MAGLGLEDGRARQALDSVAERLATPHGIVLQQPAYTHYYLHLGEISSYPPGYKENAGIFCHTNPWIMIAEAQARARRPGARLLPAHQPLGARGDQRAAPLRAVRLRPDDRRAGCAHPRRGQELLADRHGRLELRRHHAVDPGHPADLRWVEHRAGHPARAGRASRARRLYRGVRYEIEVLRVGEGNEVRLEVEGRADRGDGRAAAGGGDGAGAGEGEGGRNFSVKEIDSPPTPLFGVILRQFFAQYPPEQFL